MAGVPAVEDADGENVEEEDVEAGKGTVGEADER
jgi:hypothetical protein